MKLVKYQRFGAMAAIVIRCKAMEEHPFPIRGGAKELQRAYLL